MNIFSFGGGVQSHAALVLASQGKLKGLDGKDYKTFIFANTGNKSENPKTLEYIKNHTIQFCKDSNLEFIEDCREFVKGPRKGQKSDLYEDVLSLDNNDISIPIHFKDGGYGLRACTQKWKIEVVRRYIKLRFKGLIRYNKTKEKICLGIGISYDEIHRMRDSVIHWVDNHYPLVDLKLTRTQCLEIIKSAGLPPPPKSSCWFCPLKGKSDWKQTLLDDPEIFNMAIKFEEDMKLKAEKVCGARAKDMFLTNFKRSLSEVKEELKTNSEEDFGEECTGFCMT